MANTGHFLRVKVTLVPQGGGQPVCKMMAVEAVSTWCHFKVSAAVKLGACASHSGLDFRWEGCSIEEDDDTPVGSFMKDGDSMVLTRLEDLGQEPHANAPPASCATGTAPAPATRRRTAGRGVPRHPETAAAAEPATGQQQRSSKRASSVPRLSRPASRTSSVGEPSCASASYAPVQHIPWHGQIRRGSSDGAFAGTDRKCSCKHSKCNNCLCRDCFNTSENAEFLKAEQARTMARNPSAFSTKVETKNDGDAAHKVGCRCRRSHCIKKYCECFDSGVRCSSQCRCVDCNNQSDEPEEESGLASLASAAQLAWDMTDDALLSPGMAAAIAPYKSATQRAWPASDAAANAPMDAAANSPIDGGAWQQRRSSSNTHASSMAQYAAPGAGAACVDMGLDMDARAPLGDGPAIARGHGDGDAHAAAAAAEPAGSLVSERAGAPPKPPRWSKGMPIPAGSWLVASLAARSTGAATPAASGPSSVDAARHVSGAAASSQRSPSTEREHDSAAPMKTLTRGFEPYLFGAGEGLRLQPPSSSFAGGGDGAGAAGLLAEGEGPLHEHQLAQLDQLSQALLLQQQQQEGAAFSAAIAAQGGGHGHAAMLGEYHRSHTAFVEYQQSMLAAAAGYGLLYSGLVDPAMLQTLQMPHKHDMAGLPEFASHGAASLMSQGLPTSAALGAAAAAAAAATDVGGETYEGHVPQE